MSWYEAIKDAVAAAAKLRDANLNKLLADVMMEGAKLAEENAKFRDRVRVLEEQVQCERYPGRLRRVLTSARTASQGWRRCAVVRARTAARPWLPVG
jgi:hypothetical protein